MIILITCCEKGRHRPRLVVSHGIDNDTERPVVLPQESPQDLGAVFDLQIGEWVIKAVE